MTRTAHSLRRRVTPAFCADLLGMLALSVIVYGSLHLPTLF